LSRSTKDVKEENNCRVIEIDENGTDREIIFPEREKEVSLLKSQRPIRVALLKRKEPPLSVQGTARKIRQLRKVTASSDEESSSMISHTCRICQTDIVDDTVAIRHHLLREHNVALASYMKKYADVRTESANSAESIGDRNEPENEEEEAEEMTKIRKPKPVRRSKLYEQLGKCVFQCRICNKTLTTIHTTAFKWHVRRSHDMSIATYRLKYGDDIYKKKNFHTCLICSTSILCTFYLLRNHFAKHSLSIRNYYDRFFPAKGPRDNPSAGVSVDRAEEPKSWRRSPYASKYSWLNHCVIGCKICSFRCNSYSPMYDHVRAVHSLKICTYKKNFGDFILEKAFTLCQICGQEILSNYSVFRCHLISAHKMHSIEEYHRMYHGSNMSESNV
jgi:hypothetical protein